MIAEEKVALRNMFPDVARVLDSPIIDFHTHLGRWVQHWASEDRAEHLIAVMDQCGVEKAVVHHMMGLCTGDMRPGNDAVGRAMRAYPGRLEGAVVVNPNYPQLTRSELERCFDEYGMRIIKLYPGRHRCHLDGSAYWPIYDFASERRLIVVTHCGAMAEHGNPVELSRMAVRYPEVEFVAYHAGPDTEGARIYGECARKTPNFHVEICAPMTHNIIEVLVDEAGDDRVLFGSDTLLLSLPSAIGRIVSSKLSERQRGKVMRLNAKRLLDRLRK